LYEHSTCQNGSTISYPAEWALKGPHGGDTFTSRLPLSADDSASGWLARPCLCDFYIHDSRPVYPGAPQVGPCACVLQEIPPTGYTTYRKAHVQLSE